MVDHERFYCTLYNMILMSGECETNGHCNEKLHWSPKGMTKRKREEKSRDELR